jgi:hypothetical protein
MKKEGRGRGRERAPRDTGSGEINLGEILDFLLTNAEESVKMNFVATQGAGVAQLAEQLICNQQVGGSIPFTSSNFYPRTYPLRR